LRTTKRIIEVRGIISEDVVRERRGKGMIVKLQDMVKKTKVLGLVE
jgi:hypothetical protein